MSVPYQELSKIHRKMYAMVLPLYKVKQLQSISFHQTKNYYLIITTQYSYFPRSAQRGKDVFSRTPKKTLCKTFFLGLQACNPEFLTSTKTDSKKNFSCECSKIVGNWSGKCQQ